MSEYEQLINRIYSFQNTGSKNTIERLQLLKDICLRFDNPHGDFPTVHIAGTNGKGTVACKLSSILMANGYRVGMFTSPHIYTYRERIQINGVLISEEDVVQGLNQIFQEVSDITFFESTFLLALMHFSREEVDIAIIESGIGGRLDSTNIIDPLLSIITSVDYDHCDVLGESLDEIAAEKGGIIKYQVPVVIDHTAFRSPIIEQAESREAPLIISYKGACDIVKQALKCLPFHVETMTGINAELPCRFEQRGNVIFDIAHNPASLEHLFDKIRVKFPNKVIHVAFSFSKHKDWKASLAVIQKHADYSTQLKATHPRLINHIDLSKQVVTYRQACLYAEDCQALLVVTGSAYIMQGCI